MPPEMTLQALRAHNEALVDAVNKHAHEITRLRAEVRDLREAKKLLEVQLDALEKVLMGR